MTLNATEVGLGHAVDLASIEGYLQGSIRPVFEGFLDAIAGSEWEDLILGSFNQLAIMVALAQLSPMVPSASSIGLAISRKNDALLGDILLGFALRVQPEGKSE